MRKIFKHIKHFLIPSEKNNYRAKLLHIDSLSIIFIFVLILSLTLRSSVGQSVLAVAIDISPQALLKLVNNERTAYGLTPLKLNQQLNQAAEKKAEHMFQYRYWAHFAPDGTTPWSFILSSGYSYEEAGENLAQGYAFSQNVVDAWMASPSHKENILKPEYEDMGFAVKNGILEDNEETTLVVEMFGKRQSQTQQTIVVSAKTISPTPTPRKLIAQAKNNPPVKPAIFTSKKITVPKKMVNINIPLIIFGLLILALSLDLIFAYKLKLIRVTGKNMAHLFFLVMVTISLFLLTRGSIL